MEKITKLMNDSGWSERTITARIAFVKSIKNHIDPDGNNLNFLKDFNAVSKFILDSTKNPSTIKTKILTIKAILKLFDDKAAMKYEKLAHTVIEKADTYKGNNVAKDENKVISYEQMLEKYVTGHAPIWQLLFIIENYKQLRIPSFNYYKRIEYKNK